MKTLPAGLLIGITILCVSLLQGCKTDEVRRYTGVRDDSRGVLIVGSFNSKHDALIDGYHILNIAFVNNSPRALRLDAGKDVWMIYDSQGRSYQGINALESVDPNSWYSIPFEAQTVLAYPNFVLVGETVSFALFFRENVDLADFQRITYYSSSLDVEINGSKTNNLSNK